ncbi:hypothetical protein Trydic_g13992 [Trypoxylus dichotomus]
MDIITQENKKKRNIKRKKTKTTDEEEENAACSPPPEALITPPKGKHNPSSLLIAGKRKVGRAYIISWVHLCKADSRRARKRWRNVEMFVRSPSTVISGPKEEREGATYVCDSNDVGQVYTPPLNLYLRVKQ